MKVLRKPRIGFDFSPWVLTINAWRWSWTFGHVSGPR